MLFQKCHFHTTIYHRTELSTNIIFVVEIKFGGLL